MSKKILQIEEIYKIFKGTVDTVAIDNISCDFNRGEMTAIYGPSGSGKTTLLKCIGNIWRPTTGRIFFQDEDITKFKDERSSQYRINNIGFIFQEFNLIPSLNVRENIELPMHLAKQKDKKERYEGIERLLNKFGISRYKNSMPDELSGGEQQRVAITIALANNPEIILADEPTANLDAENRDIVLGHLKQLADEGVSVIIASHDDQVREYSDRIIKVDKGKIQV